MPDFKALVNLGQAALGYRDAVVGIMEALEKIEGFDSEMLLRRSLVATMLHANACIELADAKYNAAREVESRLPKLRRVRF